MSKGGKLKGFFFSLRREGGVPSPILNKQSKKLIRTGANLMQMKVIYIKYTIFKLNSRRAGNENKLHPKHGNLYVQIKFFF